MPVGPHHGWLHSIIASNEQGLRSWCAARAIGDMGLGASLTAIDQLFVSSTELYKGWKRKCLLCLNLADLSRAFVIFVPQHRLKGCSNLGALASKVWSKGWCHSDAWSYWNHSTMSPPGARSLNSFIHSFNKYDHKVGVIHLCDDRFQKAATTELGQNSNRHSSLVAKMWPQGQAPQQALLFTLLLVLPCATIEDAGSTRALSFVSDAFEPISDAEARTSPWGQLGTQLRWTHFC